MIETELLSRDNVEKVKAVYQPWCDKVSYYFPIDEDALTKTLFVQPEVHPANFEMVSQASLVAIDKSKPAGWIQAGYLSDIPSIPQGQYDALIRCLIVNEGRTDVARMLLERAIGVLAHRPVRAWRAFEHNSGYTFAAGIGKATDRMTDVVDVLEECGFKVEEANYVYATESLKTLSRKEELNSIEVEILTRGWSEPKADVEWDHFKFSEHGCDVGFCIAVPVGRLTNDDKETTLFIKGIAVEEKHRRRGIGHLIMSTLWDQYHQQGINRIILNTGNTNTTAQNFYKAVGYDMQDLITSYITDTITLL